MKQVSLKVAKALKEAGYYFSYEVNEYFTKYFPTYIEVWLWLWREKNINIKDTRDGAVWIWVGDNPSIYLQVSRDPEEVIVTAIEYLVNNKLLK